MKAEDFLKENKGTPGGGSAEDFLNKKTSTPYDSKDHAQLQPQFTNVDVAKTFLPLALDIAGSVLAPQLTIPHGIGTAAALARKGVNLASRAGGSYIGGAGGELGRQAVSGEDVNMAEANKQGLLGAAGEGVAAPVGLAAKNIAKPLFHLFSKVTFTGQILTKTLSNNLVEKTVGRANNFLLDIAPESVKKQSVDMDDIVLKLEKGKEEIGRIYDAYKEPLKAKSKEGKFFTPNTDGYLDFLKQSYRTKYPDLTEKQLSMRLLSEEFGYTPGGQYGKQLKRMLETGDSPTSDDFFWMLDHVYREKPKSGGTFIKVTPSQQTNRTALKKAYTMDLDESAGAQKGAADKLYMEFQDFKNVKNIFDKAIKEANLGTQTVDPFKLAKSIYMSKDAVTKIDIKRAKLGLEPYWPKLEKEAKFYTEIVPYFKQAATNVGIRPGMMGTAGSVASAIASGPGPLAASYGAYKMFGMAGIPIVEGFGAISAYSLLSPTGKKAIRMVASHGSKTGIKGGLHFGGKLIDFPQDIGFSKKE